VLVAGDGTVHRLADAFDVGYEPQFATDPFTRGGDLVSGFRFDGMRGRALHRFEAVRKAMLHFFNEHGLDLSQVAGGDRPFRSGNGGPEVYAGGLQTGVRRTLAGAVETHGRFDEGAVGERFCIGSERTNR
jgi:hypothetical protein